MCLCGNGISSDGLKMQVMLFGILYKINIVDEKLPKKDQVIQKRDMVGAGVGHHF